MILSLSALCRLSAMWSILFVVACGTEAAEPEPSWLFTFTANGVATFDADTNIVSLSTASVVGFSDRPYRLVYRVPPMAFANMWSKTSADSFTSVPPNAVMTFWDNEGMTGAPKTMVFEITESVHYVAETQTMTFGIAPLESPGTESVLPPRMYGASVFVDNATDDCSTHPNDYVEIVNTLAQEEAVIVRVATGASPGTFAVTLECADELLAFAPPIPDLRLALTTPDRRQSTTCRTTDAPIVIDAASANCRDGLCAFNLVVDSTTTLAIYATAEQQIPVAVPATIPAFFGTPQALCVQVPNDCLATNACALSTTSFGRLDLCSGPESCD